MRLGNGERRLSLSNNETVWGAVVCTLSFKITKVMSNMFYHCKPGSRNAIRNHE